MESARSTTRLSLESAWGFYTVDRLWESLLNQQRAEGLAGPLCTVGQTHSFVSHAETLGPTGVSNREPRVTRWPVTKGT